MSPHIAAKAFPAAPLHPIGSARIFGSGGNAHVCTLSGLVPHTNT
jgi:hypothetical protein